MTAPAPALLDSERDERWRPIAGFEDYEVSDLGRVRSWRGQYGWRRDEPRVLRPVRASEGYTRVSLGQHAQRSVHRLVLEAFAGPPPSPRHQCGHSNGRRDDNRLENLRWVTSQENNEDRMAHGTVPRGGNHPRARLTQADVDAIRAALLPAPKTKAGAAAVRALADTYGVTAGTIHSVRGMQTWVPR